MVKHPKFFFSAHDTIEWLKQKEMALAKQD